MKCKLCVNNCDGFCEPLQMNIDKYDCRGTFYKTRDRPGENSKRALREIIIVAIMILCASFLIIHFISTAIMTCKKTNVSTSIQEAKQQTKPVRETQYNNVTQIIISNGKVVIRTK
uniref:Uncharacterized protein n=1 Tax=viral metagenome TaxID=1070528 RepID=A0A6M3XGP0_9ZZZZ